jgi:DNA-binding beta-propeller fold protein YncE
MEPLPDGLSVFTVQSPTVQTVAASLTIPSPPSALLGLDGCPEPRGFITVTSTPAGAVDLGQGNFVPTQLLVSSDGERAYILSSTLNNILVYDIRNRTTSSIALANNALPIQGALTTGGDKLYVAGSDGTVHALDTATSADTAQITFPQGLCTSLSGTATYTCKPTLVAVKP